MNKKLLSFMVIGFIFLLSGFIRGNTRENLEKGKIIGKVVCLLDDQQSYALYLPKGYDPHMKWPILYVFDPGARARIPLQLFQPAAEKYGWIVASSYNAKNGPWEPVLEAMRAMWADTKIRLSLDLNRIYTAGFSGGARAATVFSDVLGIKVEGIIACGAGLPSMIKPEKLNLTYYHGIVGFLDFNYKEMVRLDGELSRTGVGHFIEVIDGDHAWPAAEVCSRALAGMEILAMKRGLREKDTGMIEEGYELWVNRAKEIEDAGNVFQAVKNYMHLAGLFSGLHDCGEIQKKIKSLEASGIFEKFSDGETKRNSEEWDFIKRFAGEFNAIKTQESHPLKIKKIVDVLGIEFLLAEVEKKRDIYREAMAKRLLRELELKGNADGLACFEKNDPRRAVVFFEIAARANERGFQAFYNLACVYASKLGVKDKALENLKIAVDNLQKTNHNDFSFLIDDKDLDLIRDEKEYWDLLRKVGLKK